MNITQCQLSNAQCERIDNYCTCICHYYPEFIMVIGSCLKSYICRTFETGHIENCHIVVWEFKEFDLP